MQRPWLGQYLSALSLTAESTLAWTGSICICICKACSGDSGPWKRKREDATSIVRFFFAFFNNDDEVEDMRVRYEQVQEQVLLLVLPLRASIFTSFWVYSSFLKQQSTTSKYLRVRISKTEIMRVTGLSWRVTAD